MPIVKPFKALRPKPELAKEVSCLPYDVMSTVEAREMATSSNSFLHIIRSEINYPDTVDPHSEQVYEMARQNLNDFVSKGTLFRDEKDYFYIYRQTMDGRVQIGLVALCDTNDYVEGKIKKHENTLPEKELDRMNHFAACKAQTEPVFFIHKFSDKMNEIYQKYILKTAEYNFVGDDGVGNELWIVNEENDIRDISEIMKAQESFYIADGHHRTASATKVGKQVNPNDDIMSVIFSEESLYIMDYNRLLLDIGNLTSDQFLAKISEYFEIINKGKASCKPSKKHEFAMYFDKNWYILTAKNFSFDENDPTENLDASILQNNLFDKILGIEDPRTSKRLSFVGGIRGYEYLQQQVDEANAVVAFGLFPVSVTDLLKVADNNSIMPPKSTWFEPKLRSGLFIYCYHSS